jgi:hypothetical protein
MGKNDKYICLKCGEEEFAQPPHCKCERKREKEDKLWIDALSDWIQKHLDSTPTN